jgi:hypothetical protein
VGVVEIKHTTQNFVVIHVLPKSTIYLNLKENYQVNVKSVLYRLQKGQHIVSNVLNLGVRKI